MNDEIPSSAPSSGGIRALDLARSNQTAGSLKFKSYWWEAAPRPLDVRNQSLPARADVVIVGSGFTGLSAALTLLKRGRSVIVLDAGVPGMGASTRNGGQVGSGNQKFRVAKLIALRGRRKAEELLRDGTRMLDYIEHLIASENIDCAFSRCGRFRGAMQPEHYEAMARDMEDLRDIAGVESFMVPKSEQHSEIGSDVFFGGSVLPNDASLHPGRYHAGLMERITALGGEIIGNAAVNGITHDYDGFKIRTAIDDLTCREVIVATNGYSGNVVPELGRRIVPIGSAIIATEEIPEALFSTLMPKLRVYGNTNRIFYYYRAAPGERRVVWGGRVGRLASETSAAAYRHLARDMLHVFPALRDTAVTHAWTGQIGYTYDEVPHIGCTAGGVHFALGYCGTGVSRATYFGHKIALKLLQDPEGKTAFDDLGFPSFPFHPIAKRAVPVVETWYRIRDAVNK
ncbi:FAD-binding oxidoreductase [Hyphomicrobium sp. ghe19]|uniref:NAD(P)/FAD-dependent oxidoreductase n=1 Tax=Hyphomicrobium sp. ghe19 TaxID=2682968 RepID=UPI0030D6127F